MAQKKITELQLISEITDSVMLPCDNGIQSFRTTVAQLNDYFLPEESSINDLFLSSDTSVSPSKLIYKNAINDPKWINNISVLSSVSAGALTVTIADSSGSSLSTSSIGKIAFRGSTLTSGAYSVISINSPSSMTVPSGATLGQKSAFESKIYIYAINYAGAIEVALSRSILDESLLHTTVAVDVDADAVSGIYSQSSRASVALRLIGVITNTQTTAGDWQSAGSNISGSNVRVGPNYFLATRGGTNQTGINPNNGYVKINFNVLSDSSSAEIDTTNSRFYPSVEGIYDLYAIAQINATNQTTGQYGLNFYKNGSILAQGMVASGSATTNSYPVSYRCKLLKTDYIETYLFGSGNNSSSTLTMSGGEAFSYFFGSKVN